MRQQQAHTRENKPTVQPRAPGVEEISKLAYTMWEERGRPSRSDQEDWFRAEQELKTMRPGGALRGFGRRTTIAAQQRT